MSCLWCEGDENEIQTFLKILSKEVVTDSNEAYLTCADECLPDLFFCLECVKVYHSSKSKFINKEESKKELVIVEHNRLIDHMQKIEKKIAEAGNFPEMTYLIPFVEILTYPYLCLNNTVMKLFINGLEWMIDFMAEEILEQESSYKTWFLLIICSNDKIKEWATDCIGNMNMIDNENFCKFKPIFNSILRILLKDDIDFHIVQDVETEIYDDTKIPDHIYIGRTSNEIWIACGVIFNSLESTVLKELLTFNKNDKILTLLFKEFSDSSVNIWIFLYVLEILLEKLGSSFWFLPSTNGYSPMQLFHDIKYHKEFLMLNEKLKDTPNFYQELKYSCYSQMVYSWNKDVNDKDGSMHASRLFSWILPLLKSVMDFHSDAESIVGCIFHYLMNIMDKSIVSSQLYQIVCKSIIEILNFISNLNFIWLLVPLVDAITDLLLKLSVPVFPGDVSVATAAIALVNMLVTKAHSKKQITNDLNLSFHSNYKKLQMKQPFDETGLKKILLTVLQYWAQIKTEPFTEKDNFDLLLKEVVASTEEPIIVNDVQDVYDDKAGPMELNTENYAIGLSMLGSHSPILISDDEEEEIYSHDNILAPDVDIQDSGLEPLKSHNDTVSSNKNDKEPFSQKNIFEELTSNLCVPESNQTKFEKSVISNLNDIRSTSILKSGLKESKLILGVGQGSKLKNDIFESHNKNLDEQSKNDKLKQPEENQDNDMSGFANKCFDISSNFNEPLLAKKTVPRPSTSTSMQRSSTLRREKIEQELSTKSKPLRLPNLDSKPFTISNFHKSILDWKVEWFENHMEPVETCNCLKNVGTSFESYDEYCRTFWNLMLCEAQGLVSKEWDEKSNSSIIYTVTEIDVPKTIVTNFRMKCEYKSKRMYVCCPVEEDLVLLKFTNESQSVKVFGIVEKVVINYSLENNLRISTCILKVKLGELTNSKTYKHVSVTKISSLTTVFRQFTGLIAFKNSLLASDILKPFRIKTYSCKENPLSKIKFKRLKKLNSAQLQAVSTVSHVVCQTEYVIPRIVLLQGPPGTGKSYTIKTIITHLMQDFYKSSIASKQCIKSQRMRILFCAPSNAAVDEIVRRLVCSPPWRDDDDNHSIRHGNCGDFNIIRVGYKNQVASDLESYSLEHLLANELKKYKLANNAQAIKEQLKSLRSKLYVLDIECQKLKMSTDQSVTEQYIMKTEERSQVQQSVDELNSKLNSLSEKQVDFQEEEFNLQRSLLLRADIICTTLSGAGSKPMIDAFKRSRDIPFRCVIIDEAGQCIEPDALIPLQYGSSKLVLVGDPAQLPATVLSQRASHFNFGQSLFERLFKGFIINTKTKERPAILLNYQYRMAPDICQFPNQRFYNNELKSSDTLKNGVSGLKNYVLINLDKGREDKTKMGIHNPLERDHIIAICEKLVITKTANAHDIAVITPYRQQVNLLRQELKKLIELEHIDVDTIDGFQGREKRIVILSCVRGSSQQGTIGFLSNPQRMNVALTRAKDALIIIAKCSSIEIDEDWKALVDNARERGLLFNVQNCNDTLKCIFKNPDVILQPTEFLNEKKAKSKVTANIIASNVSGKHSNINCLESPVEPTHFNMLSNPIENSKKSEFDSNTVMEKKDLKDGPINQSSINEIHPSKLASSFQANQAQADQTPVEKKKNNDCKDELLTVKDMDESLVKKINILNDKPNIELSFKMFFGSGLSSDVSYFERDNKMEVIEPSSIAVLNEEATECSHKEIIENNIAGQLLLNLQIQELMSISDSGNAEKLHLIDGNGNLNSKNEPVSFPMKINLENHNSDSTLHAIMNPAIKTFDNIDMLEPDLKKVKDSDSINECKKLKKKRKKRKKNRYSDFENHVSNHTSSGISAEQSAELMIKNVKLLKKQLKANPVMQQKIIGAVIEVLVNEKEKNSCPKSNSSSCLDLESPTYSTVSVDSDCALETEPNPSVVEKIVQEVPNYQQPTSIVRYNSGIQDFRRNKPTLSNKVPHRHSDGTYCQNICKRVLERERKKQFFADDELLRINNINKTVKWELIPLEVTTGNCYSAQKVNTSPHFISEDPRLRSTDLPANIGSPMEITDPNNSSQNILNLKNLSPNPVCSDIPDVKDITKDGSNPPNISDNRLVKFCNDSRLFELNLNLKNITLKNSQRSFQNAASKDLSIQKKMKKNPQRFNHTVGLPQPPLPSETEIRPPSPKDDPLPQISIFDDDRSSPMDICDDLKSPIITDLPVSKSHSVANLGLYQSTPHMPFNDSTFSYTYAFNNQFLYQPNLVFQSQTFSAPVLTPKSSAPLSTFYLGNDMHNCQFQDGIKSSCFDDPKLFSWRAVEELKIMKENESFNDAHRTFHTSPTTPPQKKIAYIAPQPVENQRCEKSYPCISENIDKLKNYDNSSSTSFDNNKGIDINEQALNLLNKHSEIFEESVQHIIGSNICKENQQYIVNYLKGFTAALLENQLKSVTEIKKENTSNLMSPVLDLSSDSFKNYFVNELQKSQIINKLCPGSNSEHDQHGNNSEHDQPKVQNKKGFTSSYGSSESTLPNPIQNENITIGSPTINESVSSIPDESRSSHLSNNDVIQRRIQRFGLVQKNDNDNCIVINPPKKRLVCSPSLEHKKSLKENTDKPSEAKFYDSSYECRVIIDDIKDIKGKNHDFILKKEGNLMGEKQTIFMRKVRRVKMVRTSNPKAVVKINSRQLKCPVENNSRSYAKAAKRLVSNQNNQLSNQSSINKSVEPYKNSEITEIQQTSVVDKCNLRQQNEGRSPAFLNEKNKTFNVFSRLGSRSSAERLCSEAKTSSKSMYLDNRGSSLDNENDECTGARLDSKRVDTYNKKRSLTDHQNLDVIKRFKSESPNSNVFNEDYIEKKSEKRGSEIYKNLRTSYDRPTYDFNKHNADYSPTSDERKHYLKTSHYDKKNAYPLRQKFKRH